MYIYLYTYLCIIETQACTCTCVCTYWHVRVTKISVHVSRSRKRQTLITKCIASWIIVGGSFSRIQEETRIQQETPSWDQAETMSVLANELLRSNQAIWNSAYLVTRYIHIHIYSLANQTRSNPWSDTCDLLWFTYFYFTYFCLYLTLFSTIYHYVQKHTEQSEFTQLIQIVRHFVLAAIKVYVRTYVRLFLAFGWKSTFPQLIFPSMSVAYYRSFLFFFYFLFLQLKWRASDASQTLETY